jgi:hypothetical protein
MRRDEVPAGAEIDHRDAGSKVFVWLVRADGERELYGIKRLCAEFSISFGTFWGRWIRNGSPDVVKPSMLSDPGASYNLKREGWKVDGVWFVSTRAVAAFVHRAESTVVERFQDLGRREATYQELAYRKPRAKEKATRVRAVQPHAMTVRLMPDGTEHTFDDLASRAEVGARHLRRRAKENGGVLWPADLKRQIAKPYSEPARKVIRNIHDVEYNPSLAESAMMRF